MEVTILLGVRAWHTEERSEVPLFPFKQLCLGPGLLVLRLWHRIVALPDFAHAATAATPQPLPQAGSQGALPPHLVTSLSSCRVWLQLLLCPRGYRCINYILFIAFSPSFSCSFLSFLPMNHNYLYLWVTVEVAWHACVVQHDQTDGHHCMCVSFVVTCFEFHLPVDSSGDNQSHFTASSPNIVFPLFQTDVRWHDF